MRPPWKTITPPSIGGPAAVMSVALRIATGRLWPAAGTAAAVRMRASRLRWARVPGGAIGELLAVTVVLGDLRRVVVPEEPAAVGLLPVHPGDPSVQPLGEAALR